MSDAGTLPARATRWVASTIGSRARVVRVRALPGATSSSVHAVDVDDAGGNTHRLVLRRYVRAEVPASEPDAVAREAMVLGALAGSSVPAPRCVAADPDGSTCDVPALLMTRLPGRPRTRPRDLDSFLEQLAAPLEAIHSVALPADGFLSAATDRTAYDPAWDLLDAVDALPDLDDSGAALRRLDEFVARAVAAAGLS